MTGRQWHPVLKLSWLLVVVGLFWLVGRTAFPTLHNANRTVERNEAAQAVLPVVQVVDKAMRELWEQEGLRPAAPAGELTILRRLSLALHGTVPSLEEIRQFEADTHPDRLPRWIEEMLRDSRFADYFAERLTRVFVGVQREPFLIFRRDLFKSWMSDQLRRNRPYDQMVWEMIAQPGLWTGEPATNFITHGVIDKEPNPAKLTGRTVRAVLGQRIDCAECHNHPFANWKQRDFQGLAAFYGQVKLSPFGVEDDPKRRFRVTDRNTLEEQVIEPAVPFGEDWLTTRETFRQSLADWCINSENRRFSRAAVNRVWGLLFGKAWSEGAPYQVSVDDLPDPEEETSATPLVLDILAEDFVAHGYDLRRLMRVILSTEAFRMDSRAEIVDDQELQRHLDHWAVFPLTRLRPEQVVGAMLQAASIKTIDQNAALITRTVRLLREADFVREYGDLGENELEERSGTVPQALLRMNGKLAAEATEPNPFNATPRLAIASGSPERLLENCYLVTLTRRPLDEERSYFLGLWQETTTRPDSRRVQDLQWILFNSPEFSWNH